MHKRMGPSLADIAKATGVTVATVSRVLNNRYEGFSVRPELRDKIMQTAKELHYRPDLMAQSLRKADMGIIGLLGTNLPLVIPEYTLRSLITTFEANNLKLTTYFANSIATSHDLPPWRVDGAIVTSALNAQDIEPVERAGIPYVSINGWCGKNGISVQFDDVQGTRLIMEHLLGLGHKRIAYANTGGPWGNHPSVAIRHQTYLACLREHGLKPVLMHDQPIDQPVHDFVRTVVREGGATAILAYHNFHAVYIMQAAAELGIRIPQDVSLACFNDEYPIQFLHPRVTAVALPAAEAGTRAAELLIEQIKSGHRKGVTVTLKENLVARESTVQPTPSSTRETSASVSR